ncbi:hypothetical protein ACB040_13720 [Aeromonas sp. S11(2024)]|uniref:DinB/UmuC family translesion DNA polymerase n=1 Tax=Aeromonas TaxID=642 RepID=UPI0035285148
MKAKQQIIFSRSVGERITQIGAMHQALACYMERAAEKLRAEGMCCRHITLFIHNSPFNDKEPYYGNQINPRVAIHQGPACPDWTAPIQHLAKWTPLPERWLHAG